VIRRGHLFSLHVEAHLSNRPAPLTARFSVSPWKKPCAPLVRRVTRPLWPLRSDLDCRRPGVTPCRHSPFAQNRHRSVSLHYPPALVTYRQVPCHSGAFYRDIRDRSRAKSVEKTWQAYWTYKQVLKLTADIHHPRMIGCLIMTRRVGEGSRTRALDLTRQRACGPRCAGGLGWGGLLRNRRLGTTHRMLLVWLCRVAGKKPGSAACATLHPMLSAAHFIKKRRRRRP
jgi:hypothetical protein